MELVILQINRFLNVVVINRCPNTCLGLSSSERFFSLELLRSHLDPPCPLKTSRCLSLLFHLFLHVSVLSYCSLFRPWGYSWCFCSWKSCSAAITREEVAGGEANWRGRSCGNLIYTNSTAFNVPLWCQAFPAEGSPWPPFSSDELSS